MVVANAVDLNTNKYSRFVLETTQSILKTQDPISSGKTELLTKSDAISTQVFTALGGPAVASITSTAGGHAILGDTAVTGALSATGLSTLSGVDNRNANITNAGRISGVTDGAISAASTDAVNGSQLFATNAAVTTAQTDATQALINAATAQATAEAAVQYDTGSRDKITFNPGGSAVMVSNVKAGTAASDAVNFSQLNAVQNQVTGLNSRVGILETGLKSLRFDLNTVEDIASRGVAIASAMASIPSLPAGKSFGVGMGVGSYNGKTAFSATVGFKIQEDFEFRLNAGTAGSGDVAVSGGGMMSW